MGKTVSFNRPDGKSVNGYLAEPPTASKAPALVVIQEWWGLNDQIRGVADKVAKGRTPYSLNFGQTYNDIWVLQNGRIDMPGNDAWIGPFIDSLSIDASASVRCRFGWRSVPCRALIISSRAGSYFSISRPFESAVSFAKACFAS